jgi:hypothetical protein
MQSSPIRIETYRILAPWIHFPAITVSDLSFLGNLAPSVSTMRTALPSDAFPIDAIQYEEAKASQSDGGGFFKLSLRERGRRSDLGLNDHPSSMRE